MAGSPFSASQRSDLIFPKLFKTVPVHHKPAWPSCWTTTTVTWQPRGIEARVAVLGGQEQISKIHNKIHNKIHKLGVRHT